MSRCGAGQQRQLVTPLAEAEEQRPQDRADEQPLAHRHRDHGRARRGAEHEADRDRQHIENHDVLQHARIRGEQRHVRRGNPAERRPQPERRGQRRGADDHAAAPSAAPGSSSPAAIGRCASADAADRPRDR